MPWQEIVIGLVLFWVIVPMVLVAVGLPFKKNKGERKFKDGTKTTQYDLPSWLKWMSNPEDGLTGDSKGWYWNEKMAGKPDWFKMWWWSGVRNTWNYLKRFVIGIDVREYTFHKLVGDDYVRDDLKNQGFQIIYAKPRKGWFPRPMLYWVKELHNGHGICFQLGWKIKLSHETVVEKDEWDYFKGITFEPNPYKDLT